MENYESAVQTESIKLRARLALNLRSIKQRFFLCFGSDLEKFYTLNYYQHHARQKQRLFADGFDPCPVGQSALFCGPHDKG